MSNIFDSLGLDKDGAIAKATELIDQHRDQIPDPIEGKIDEALHGGMVGGLLDKIGLGGHHEEATSQEEGATEEEATEEESTEETEEEEEEPAEEEATEEESEESPDEEASDEVEAQ
jgi:hypothetical protein